MLQDCGNPFPQKGKGVTLLVCIYGGLLSSVALLVRQGGG